MKTLYETILDVDNNIDTGSVQAEKMLKMNAAIKNAISKRLGKYVGNFRTHSAAESEENYMGVFEYWYKTSTQYDTATAKKSIADWKALLKDLKKINGVKIDIDEDSDIEWGGNQYGQFYYGFVGFTNYDEDKGNEYFPWPKLNFSLDNVGDDEWNIAVQASEMHIK